MRFSANQSNGNGPQGLFSEPAGQGGGHGQGSLPKGPGEQAHASQGLHPSDSADGQVHGGAGPMAHAADAAGPAGQCTDPLDATSLDYSEESIAQLLFMIEEEKFAGDLYQAFYEQTDIIAFANIAASEDRHMAAMVDQAQSIGLDIDALLALPAGDYQNEDLDALYLQLLETGSASTQAALEVGVLVESTDIADLEQASIGLVGTPLGTAYEHLLDGSTAHLAAFEALLGG